MANKIGIDVGKQGALCIIDDDGHAQSWPLKIDGDAVDAGWLATMCQGAGLVVVERQQARPTDGRASLFSIALQYGFILGVLRAHRIPHQVVSPQTWKAKVLVGTAKDKDAAIQFVKSRFPEVDLCPGKKTKPHDGMAESVCIAVYARAVS